MESDLSGSAILVDEGGLLPTPDLKVYTTFDTMGLPDKLLRGIFA